MRDINLNRDRSIPAGVSSLFSMARPCVLKSAATAPAAGPTPSRGKWYSPLKAAAQKVWKAYRGGPLPYSDSDRLPFDGIPLRDLHGLSFANETERQADVQRTEEYRKTAPDWWEWRGDLERLKTGTPEIRVRVRPWPTAGKYTVLGASNRNDSLPGRPSPTLLVPTRNSHHDFKYKDGDIQGPLRHLRSTMGSELDGVLAHEVQHMISKPLAEGRFRDPKARVRSMDLSLAESARKDKDTAREEVEPTAASIKYMMRKAGVNPYGHAARPWLRMLFEDRREDVPPYLRQVPDKLPDAFYDRLLHVIRGVSSTNRQMQKAATYA